MFSYIITNYYAMKLFSCMENLKPRQFNRNGKLIIKSSNLNNIHHNNICNRYKFYSKDIEFNKQSKFLLEDMMKNLKMEIADDEIITLQQHDIKNNTFIYDNNSKQNRLSIKYEPEKFTVEYQARQWISNIDYKPLINETKNVDLEIEGDIKKEIHEQITPYITDPKMILMQDICKEISITSYEGKEITLNLKNIKKNPYKPHYERPLDVDIYELAYVGPNNTSCNLEIKIGKHLYIESILINNAQGVIGNHHNISNIQFGSFINIPQFNSTVKNTPIEPMKGQINLNSHVLLDCLSYLLCSNQTMCIYKLFNEIHLNMKLKENEYNNHYHNQIQSTSYYKYLCDNMQIMPINNNSSQYIFTYQYNNYLLGKSSEQYQKNLEDDLKKLPHQVQLIVELENHNIKQLKIQSLDHQHNEVPEYKGDKYEINSVKIKTIIVKPTKNHEENDKPSSKIKQLDLLKFQDFSNYINTQVVYYDQQRKEFIYFTNKSVDEQIFADSYDLSILDDKFEQKQIFGPKIEITYQLGLNKNSINNKKTYDFKLSSTTEKHINMYFKENLDLLNIINDNIAFFYQQKEIDTSSQNSLAKKLYTKYSNKTLEYIKSIDSFNEQNIKAHTEHFNEFLYDVQGQINSVHSIPSKIEVSGNRVINRYYGLGYLINSGIYIKEFKFKTYDQFSEDKNSDLSTSYQSSQSDKADVDENKKKIEWDSDEKNQPYQEYVNNDDLYYKKNNIWTQIFICAFITLVSFGFHVTYTKYLDSSKEEYYHEHIQNPEQ